jgi:hypothetical protein
MMMMMMMIVFHSQNLHVNILFLSLKYACSPVRLGDTAVYRYCCNHACKIRAATGAFSACAELTGRLVCEPQAHSLPISSVPRPTDFKKSLAYSAVRNGLISKPKRVLGLITNTLGGVFFAYRSTNLVSQEGGLYTDASGIS